MKFKFKIIIFLLFPLGEIGHVEKAESIYWIRSSGVWVSWKFIKNSGILYAERSSWVKIFKTSAVKQGL